MLMLSNSFQEIISFVISSHQIITYREEVYSEHGQTFKMEHCAKRIIPKCMELWHFNKQFEKHNKKVPMKKHFGVLFS